MTVRHMRSFRPRQQQDKGGPAGALEPGGAALDPHAVLAAEAILLIGMHQFAHKSALMQIMCAGCTRRRRSLAP